MKLLHCGQVVPDLVFDGGFDEERIVVTGAGGFESAAAGSDVGAFGDGVFELHQEWWGFEVAGFPAPGVADEVGVGEFVEE